MFDLTGKTVVVTGGAQGIGKSVAAFLGKSGASAAIADYNIEAAQLTVAELEASGIPAMCVKTDVSDSEQVKQMVAKTLDRFGSIDILVNCAGILQDKFVTEISDDEWDRMIDIHVKGTFLFSREVLPGMIERNFGRIINISSLGARQTIAITGSHYCSAKGGIVAFTRQMAQQLAYKGYNITANCVSPGTTMTPMVAKRAPEVIQWIIDQFPAGRLGTTDEIGFAILYLASEWAGYINGETIDINGGKYLM